MLPLWIQSGFEWCLNEVCRWIGDEKGGGAVFGASAAVVALALSVAAKRLFDRLKRRFQGEHLPEREFVQQLRAKMGDARQWTAGISKDTSGKITGHFASFQSHDPASTTPVTTVRDDSCVWVNGKEVILDLNKKEQRLLRESLKVLLQRIAENTKQKTQEDAERTLKTALNGSENVPDTKGDMRGPNGESWPAPSKESPFPDQVGAATRDPLCSKRAQGTAAAAKASGG